MILLATVTVFTVAIASGAAVMKRVPTPVAESRPIELAADRTPVRMIGAPFVPNTNPRER